MLCIPWIFYAKIPQKLGRHAKLRRIVSCGAWASSFEDFLYSEVKNFLREAIWETAVCGVLVKEGFIEG